MNEVAVEQQEIKVPADFEGKQEVVAGVGASEHGHTILHEKLDEGDMKSTEAMDGVGATVDADKDDSNNNAIQDNNDNDEQGSGKNCAKVLLHLSAYRSASVCNSAFRVRFETQSTDTSLKTKRWRWSTTTKQASGMAVRKTGIYHSDPTLRSRGNAD